LHIIAYISIYNPILFGIYFFLSLSFVLNIPQPDATHIGILFQNHRQLSNIHRCWTLISPSETV